MLVDLGENYFSRGKLIGPFFRFLGYLGRLELPMLQVSIQYSMYVNSSYLSRKYLSMYIRRESEKGRISHMSSYGSNKGLTHDRRQSSIIRHFVRDSINRVNLCRVNF